MEGILTWLMTSSDGVRGLCLDPHDLAIAKYVAGREKDEQFNRQLVLRGLLNQETLRKLLAVTPVDQTTRARVEAAIAQDFAARKA